jgi:hypothetical protein
MTDPAPTPTQGIEATVQRALVRMRDVGIQAVPIEGPCAGAKSKAGHPFGRCYSCRELGPRGGKFAPRLEWGAVPDCLDHVPVHGGSLPREQGIEQDQGCGGVCYTTHLGAGVSA